MSKREYREIVQDSLPKRIEFSRILQVAATCDKPIVIVPETSDHPAEYDPHRVHYGYGQRSALNVLLRALDTWKKDQ